MMIKVKFYIVTRNYSKIQTSTAFWNRKSQRKELCLISKLLSVGGKVVFEGIFLICIL